MKNTPEFYLVDELATKLRVNPMTIYRYIKAGKLRAVKIGKEFRIDRGIFSDFITRQTVNKVSRV